MTWDEGLLGTTCGEQSNTSAATGGHANTEVHGSDASEILGVVASTLKDRGELGTRFTTSTASSLWKLACFAASAAWGKLIKSPDPSRTIDLQRDRLPMLRSECDGEHGSDSARLEDTLEATDDNRVTSCTTDLFDLARSVERPLHARASVGGSRSHWVPEEPGKSVGNAGTDINKSRDGTTAESTRASGGEDCSFALLRSTGDFPTRWDTGATAGRLTGDLPTRWDTASLRVRGEPGVCRDAIRGLATTIWEADLVLAPFAIFLEATLGLATRPSP